MYFTGYLIIKVLTLQRRKSIIYRLFKICNICEKIKQELE